MPRDLVQLGRSFLLSLGGEGLQSGFHFILNLILIRVLTTYEFGVFAIVFVLGGISLIYGNALVSVPAAIQMARLKSPGAVNYQDVVFGSIALVISAAIGLVVAAGLWLTIGQTAEALAGGAFVGLWSLRNHVRTALFARRMMAPVTFSDFSYATSGAAFVAILLYLRPDVSQVTDALWGLAAANVVAICVAFRALGIRARISFRRMGWQLYRAMRPDIGWSLVSAITWNVQSQALTFLVAIIAGPAAYAPIAAAIVLFSPLRPAISAVINVFRPDFASALAEGRYRRATVTLYSLCGIIILSCLAGGALIWLGWPFLQAHVFAGKFVDASMPLIIALTGLSVLVYSTYNVPLLLIQAAGQFKPIAIATTLGGMVGLAAVCVLLSVTSVEWSVAGVVAGELVCGVCLWIAARHLLRTHVTPASKPDKAVTAPAGVATEWRT